MRSLRIFCLAATAWLLQALLAAPFAVASANVSCGIDDKNLKFMLEAIASRSGPIMQVSESSIRIKPAAAAVTVTREHIVQQWIAADDLRLQIVVDGETAEADSLDLVVLSRLDRKPEKEKYSDKYAGSYVLKISGRKGERELKGRVRCEIG